MILTQKLTQKFTQVLTQQLHKSLHNGLPLNKLNNKLNYFIYLLNNKKEELKKEHGEFQVYLLLNRWCKEQPEFIGLTEDEQRKVLMEI